ncbi:MAG TPA: helix-turn-helix domain-containing protein [Vicinamibacterales bacterium]|nr:helix-turn-helix domain-containing protein [Vicinamibacterales bacterium]
MMESESSAGASQAVSAATSIDKAFEVCEALSHEPAGLSLSELARRLKLPRPTVHRLLGVLRRRGYVRQDEETQRYSLGIKMLDLSFRVLGRSELRLHAYPILRDYAVQSGQRVFLAVPGAGEVTYIWSPAGGKGQAAMRTVYGREMPAHCSVYFDRGQAGRRLTCLKLHDARDVARSEELARGFGQEDAPAGAQRLYCTCAPVRDYTGREVARVGVFGHGPDDRPILGVHNRGAWELARHISMRLGYLSGVALGVA